MRSTLRRGAVVVIGAAAALSIGMGSAIADPNLADDGSALPGGFLPDANDLVGTGSDTIQHLTNALGRGYNGAGGVRLASFDALNPQTGLPGGNITIRNADGLPGNGDDVVIARPNGSGAGITTLINNTNVDFARSSRPSNGSTAEDALAFIPFASDGLSYIVDDASFVPTGLSASDLRDIYTCQLPGFNAKLPQAGSGTRAFFLQQIGVTETEIATAVATGCVDDTVQEHDAAAVDNDPFALAPFSSARFAVNPPDPTNPPSNSVVLASEVDSAAFAVSRDVFHVIREGDVGTAKFAAVFGPDGIVCAALADGEQGFDSIGARCGVPNEDV
jgi:ABC-type phosphate transport system substrate-binding protein